jgi:Fe-Mn family superoxide dismutase
MKSSAATADRSVQFDLPPLPYAEDALAPVISAETLSLHHGKHHRKYVDTMNQLLREQPVEGRSLEEVVKKSSGKLFNNAAQAWNHDFYWKSLSPRGGKPSAALLRQLEKDFGSFERFTENFAAAATAQFGSGWAWLVKKPAGLEIVTTSNADTPMKQGVQCLLTVDVWEHAYYVDYLNQRERYLSAVIGSRLNWSFAEENFNR